MKIGFNHIGPDMKTATNKVHSATCATVQAKGQVIEQAEGADSDSTPGSLPCQIPTPNRQKLIAMGATAGKPMFSMLGGIGLPSTSET